MDKKDYCKTERLHMRPLVDEDSRFIYELVNTDGWLTFIGNRNVNSDDDAIAYIQRINANENVIYWTVNKIETAETIGIITFIKRDYLEHHDIGFAFLPRHHGNGYAYEAAQSILEYLKKEKNLSTILATTIPSNVSSIQLLEKLGLAYDKEIYINNEILHVYQSTV